MKSPMLQSQSDDMATYVSTIHAMRLQEETVYHQTNLKSSHTRRNSVANIYVKLVDKLHYPPTVAAIALQCMDRYVAYLASLTPTSMPMTTNKGKKKTGKLTNAQYSVTAMAMLYTTIKAHEKQAISPKQMIALWRYFYNHDKEIINATRKSNLEELERKILFTLQWRIHPPTVIDFIRYFILTCCHFWSPKEQDHIHELATNSVLLDHKLSWTTKQKGSSLALVAIMDAMDIVIFHDDINGDSICQFQNLLCQLARIDMESFYSLQQELSPVAIFAQPPANKFLSDVVAPASALHTLSTSKAKKASVVSKASNRLNSLLAQSSSTNIQQDIDKDDDDDDEDSVVSWGNGSMSSLECLIQGYSNNRSPRVISEPIVGA